MGASVQFLTRSDAPASGQQSAGFNDTAFGAQKRRLLIIDDDSLVCRALSEIAMCLGWAVQTTTDSRQATALVELFDPDAIILDVVMPDRDGIEVLTALSGLQCTADILILSGYEPLYLSVAVEIARSKGFDRVSIARKPITFEELEGFLVRVPLRCRYQNPGSP